MAELEVKKAHVKLWRQRDAAIYAELQSILTVIRLNSSNTGKPPLAAAIEHITKRMEAMEYALHPNNQH